MPLDHENGEDIQGFGGPKRVVPAAKYQSLPRLTVIVREAVGKKFKVEADVERPLWIAALGYAQVGFFKDGAGPHTTFDVIAQEYPLTGHVVFVFCARIRGEEKLVVAPFVLSPQQIADLKVAGHWADLQLN